MKDFSSSKSEILPSKMQDGSVMECLYFFVEACKYIFLDWLKICLLVKTTQFSLIIPKNDLLVIFNSQEMRVEMYFRNSIDHQ